MTELFAGPSTVQMRLATGNAIAGTFTQLADQEAFTQAGTGAVIRSINSKIGEQLSVTDFGATGDGVTDDTAAIQAALDSGASRVLLVGGSNGFVIDSTITIPESTTLESDYAMLDPRDASDYANLKNRIILNSAATITLGESASVRGLAILRKGITIPANAAEVANFAGVAITTAASTHGQYIGYSVIAGFDTGVLSDAATNTEQIRCEYLNIDCTNGISIARCFDAAEISYCRCWPATSIGLGAPVDADNQRGGTAFSFSAVGDGNRMAFCQSFGYKFGYTIDACNLTTIMNCAADYTVTSTASPIGFNIAGASGSPRLIACVAFGLDIGYKIATTGITTMIGCLGEDNDTEHVRLGLGKTTIIGGKLEGGSGNGITVNQVGPSLISGIYFKDIAGDAIESLSAGSINEFKHVDCTFENITGANVVFPWKPKVASASPLVLNGSDQHVQVSGTTGFSNITDVRDYAGKLVTLYFLGILTVTDGANIKMAGNFITSANDTLTLVSDGSLWLEVSRSTN